jgi:Isocitrate/isopropylmalate dehydrogenase
VLVSGVMMFEHLGWADEAAAILTAPEATIDDKIGTYDFACQMEGATPVSCSEFAAAFIDRLWSDAARPRRSRLDDRHRGRRARVDRWAREGRWAWYGRWARRQCPYGPFSRGEDDGIFGP